MIGECIYHGDAVNTQNWHGVCLALPAQEVPEGCPIYALVPHDEAPYALNARVQRGAQELSITPSYTVEGTATQSITTLDVRLCPCPTIDVPVSFDRITASLPGVVAGDAVWFPRTSAEGAHLDIIAAGPCPAPVWPTHFEQVIVCDTFCSPDHPVDDGGCSAAPGAGLAFGAVILFAWISRT